MNRRVALALVAAFCAGLLAGRLARPAPPQPLSPDFSAALRLNVIDGTKVTGGRLIPYRVVRDGRVTQVAPEAGRDLGQPRYQIVYEGAGVEVFLQPDPAAPPAPPTP